MFAYKLLASNKIEEAVTDNLQDTILLGDGVLKVGIQNNKIQWLNIHPGTYFPEIRQPYTQTPYAHNIIYEEDSNTDWMVCERYWLNEETNT